MAVPFLQKQGREDIIYALRDTQRGVALPYYTMTVCVHAADILGVAQEKFVVPQQGVGADETPYLVSVSHFP